MFPTLNVWYGEIAIILRYSSGVSATKLIRLETKTETIYGKRLYNAIKALDATRLVTAGGMAGGGLLGATLTGPQWSYLDIGDTHYVFNAYPAAHENHPTKPMICGESWPYEAYEFWQPVLR